MEWNEREAGARTRVKPWNRSLSLNSRKTHKSISNQKIKLPNLFYYPPPQRKHYIYTQSKQSLEMTKTLLRPLSPNRVCGWNSRGPFYFSCHTTQKLLWRLFPQAPIKHELTKERDPLLYPWFPNTSRNSPTRQALAFFEWTCLAI